MQENEEMKKVNAWPVDKKKKYLICRMSPYESLLRYYSKHEVFFRPCRFQSRRIKIC
jgi:hypothetical protein